MAHLLAHVRHKGEDCLIWPYSRDDKGYGQVSIGGGKIKKAHRVMCEIVNGSPPTSKHQAAHECGNGHLGCFNPRHLKWKTNSENQKDRRKFNRHWGSKGARTPLSIAQIEEMRRLKGIESRVSIAKRMGVKRGCVQYWQTHDRPPVPAGTSYSAVWKRNRKLRNSRLVSQD